MGILEDCFHAPQRDRFLRVHRNVPLCERPDEPVKVLHVWVPGNRLLGCPPHSWYGITSSEDCSKLSTPTWKIVTGSSERATAVARSGEPAQNLPRWGAWKSLRGRPHQEEGASGRGRRSFTTFGCLQQPSRVSTLFLVWTSLKRLFHAPYPNVVIIATREWHVATNP